MRNKIVVALLLPILSACSGPIRWCYEPGACGADTKQESPKVQYVEVETLASVGGKITATRAPAVAHEVESCTAVAGGIRVLCAQTGMHVEGFPADNDGSILVIDPVKNLLVESFKDGEINNPLGIAMSDDLHVSMVVDRAPTGTYARFFYGGHATGVDKQAHDYYLPTDANDCVFLGQDLFCTDNVDTNPATSPPPPCRVLKMSGFMQDLTIDDLQEYTHWEYVLDTSDFGCSRANPIRVRNGKLVFATLGANIKDALVPGTKEVRDGAVYEFEPSSKAFRRLGTASGIFDSLMVDAGQTIYVGDLETRLIKSLDGTTEVDFSSLTPQLAGCDIGRAGGLLHIVCGTFNPEKERILHYSRGVDFVRPMGWDSDDIEFDVDDD